MSDSVPAMSLLLAFLAIVHPFVAAIGILVGRLAPRWPHLLIAPVAAPVSCWAPSMLHSGSPSYFWESALPLAVGGLGWSIAAFGVKEAADGDSRCKDIARD
jgi:hypothetical protein